MPLLTRNSRSVTLSRRVFSWDNNGAALGSAYNYAEAISSNTETLSRDVEHIWSTQRSVRTVVKFVARNIAQVGLHSFIMQTNGDRSRARDTDVTQLIEAPSAYKVHYEWLYEMVIDLLKYERFLAELMRGPNGEYWAVPIPPYMWKFKRDALRNPAYIEFIDGSTRKTTNGNFFWIDGYPDDVDGMNAIYTLLQEDHSAQRYRTNLWAKGARTSGVITRSLEAPPWSKAARAKFMTQWAKVEAGAEMEGGTALLEDGMEYQRTRPITPSDAQQLETTKLHESQVAAAFGVPPVFVGLMDNANYSNVVGFREHLYGDTLGPWFVHLAQAFNQRIVKFIGEPGEFVEFNVDAKLRMSFKDRNEMLLRQVGQGTPIISPNEARRVMNYPSLGPEYDKPIIPIYIQEDDGDDDEGAAE